MQLRPYQQKMVGQILSSFQDHDRVLAQLATGGGKTPLACYVIKHALHKQIPVLFVAHREELLTQAQSQLARQGIASGMIKSGYPEDRGLLCQVGSIQSLNSRDLPKAGLLILDECHHSISATFLELIRQYPKAKILGLTATPYRLDGTGLNTVFQDLIRGPSVKWLIQNGYLSPYRCYVSEKKIDTSKIKTVAGDYSQSGLAKAANKPALRGDLVSHWREYAHGKRTLVFAVNVEHSRSIVDQYQRSGVSAEHVDGKTSPIDRREILTRFAQGKTLILSNVEIATEGFDLPAIDCVQLARPTKSLALALQMIGRALRVSEGKRNAIILDHAGIIAEHGYPDDYREWSLEGNPIPQPARFKRCRRCNAAIDRKSKRCPHCGYVYEQSARSPIVLIDEQDVLEEDWNPDSVIPDFFDDTPAEIEEIPDIWTPDRKSIDQISRSIRESLEPLGVPQETIDRMVQAAITEALTQDGHRFEPIAEGISQGVLF